MTSGRKINSVCYLPAKFMLYWIQKLERNHRTKIADVWNVKPRSCLRVTSQHLIFVAFPACLMTLWQISSTLSDYSSFSNLFCLQRRSCLAGQDSRHDIQNEKGSCIETTSFFPFSFLLIIIEHCSSKCVHFSSSFRRSAIFFSQNDEWLLFTL